MNEEIKDFGNLLDAKMSGMSTTIPTGKKVKGIITKIGKETVFVDLGVQCDGYMDRKDLLDSKGELKYKEGDAIEAVNMGWSDEGYHLVMKVSRDMTDTAVEQAFESKLPIEGKVLEERKGGFGVQVSNVTGFCPFSQMDARGVKKEPAEYIGQTYMFMIQEYGEEGRNLVLSRRVLLEKEAKEARERLKDSLYVGMILDGTVVKVMPFGVFVDLGGIEGMVHVSEMGWARALKPEDIVKEGDTVQVKVIDIDWGDGSKKERVALSMKQAQGDPWDRIAHELGYAEGIKRKGKVTRLADFGAFIELEPGIEGLAHISQLGVEEHVNHPSDVLKEGQEVEVTILGIDFDRRRISLCIGEPKVKDEKPAELTAEQEQEVVERVNIGEVIEGEGESLKPYGVFVLLPNGQKGMLHISQTPYSGQSAASSRAFFKAYPLHSKLQVVIREVNGDRISLTLPETLEQEQEANRTEAMNVKDSKDASFGSLGDLFGGLSL